MTRIPVLVKGYVSEVEQSAQSPRMAMPKRATILRDGDAASTTLTATILPADATCKKIEWTVSNNALTISANNSQSGEAITISASQPFQGEIYVIAKASIDYSINNTCVVTYSI